MTLNRLSKRNQRGHSLVEVLISSVLVAVSVGAILFMAVGGKKTTEYEARYLQAMAIGEFICSEINKAAVSDMSSLPTEPDPLPLTGNDGQVYSSYGNRLFHDAEYLESRFPELAEQLDNYRVSVTIDDLDDLEQGRLAKITVFFRLSQSKDTWHHVRFTKIAASHSPL